MICDTPYYVLPKAATEKVPVPCGKCPPCKMRRVNSWVFRMLEQEKLYDHSHFVTLTYDTRYVPISPNGFMTLQKRDFQLFMKRLRKLTPAKLKYYAVGEYGSTNNRPHFHAIIFGVENLEHIHDAWGLGRVDIGTVTGDSIAYTMKYIDKPGGNPLYPGWKPFVGRDDRVLEFPLMSKALGANYLTDHMIAYHKADLSRLYATKLGGHRVALPRYYRDKIYSDDEKREQVKIIQAIQIDNDVIDRQEYEQVYGGTEFTYEQWKESKRYGRYHSFYARQKKRDI